MEISAFFRRFLAHFASALVVLFLVLVIGEYFVPGSVLPFVNLIDLAIPMLVCVAISLIFPPKRAQP